MDNGMWIMIIATSSSLGFLFGMLLMALLACSKPNWQAARVRSASSVGRTQISGRLVVDDRQFL